MHRYYTEIFSRDATEVLMTPYGYIGCSDHIYGVGRVYSAHKDKRAHKGRKKRARQAGMAEIRARLKNGI